MGLVDAEDDDGFWRAGVEPDDVAHLDDANARTCPNFRRLLVRRIEEEG